MADSVDIDDDYENSGVWVNLRVRQARTALPEVGVASL